MSEPRGAALWNGLRADEAGTIRERHVHRNREMIGNRLVQHAHAVHLNGRGHENVIDVSPRAPTRKGKNTVDRLTQVPGPPQPLDLLALGTTVEISHHDDVTLIRDQF